MPITSRTNNRVLPANSRAVDVAKKALRDLAGAQQRRYANAFEIDSHESVIYNRLTQGVPCSCQSHSKALATLLDEEGKMPQGVINEMLTGMTFRVNRYGQRQGTRDDLRVERGEDDTPANENAPQSNPLLPGARRVVPDFDYMSMDLDDDVATELNMEGTATNGPVRSRTLDDAVGDFDTDVDLGDSSCTLCYGTGFVGGYTVQGGWRQSLSSQWLPKPVVSGLVEANQRPHAFYSTRVDFSIVLPKGFVFLDTFRVWNNEQRVVPTSILIDNLSYTPSLFAALCDGNRHTVSVIHDEMTYWTHLEIQVCQTEHASLIEFPTLTQGADLSRLDSTEDTQISASPLVPMLRVRDVIVESVQGQPFILGSTTVWVDKLKNTHGWDCSARVIQKSELLGLLPRRRKMPNKTTTPVRDNATGTRRT